MTTLEPITTDIHPAVGEWELPEFLAESDLPSRDGDRVIQYREALMKHISTLRTTTTPEGEECDDACVSRACPTC